MDGWMDGWMDMLCNVTTAPKLVYVQAGSCSVLPEVG